MLAVPASAVFLMLWDQTSPTSSISRLLLIWVLLTAHRSASQSVRHWTENVHLLAGGLVWAAFGLRGEPTHVTPILGMACFLEALVVEGLHNGWWEQALAGTVSQPTSHSETIG